MSFFSPAPVLNRTNLSLLRFSVPISQRRNICFNVIMQLATKGKLPGVNPKLLIYDRCHILYSVTKIAEVFEPKTFTIDREGNVSFGFRFR